MQLSRSPSVRLPLTRSSRMTIFSDFDGTISNRDSLKSLLNRFAGSSWHWIERRLLNGTMPESDGLQKAFDLIDVSEDEALEFVLEHIQVDPWFKDFVGWTRNKGYDLRILSGGFNQFIYRLLKRERIFDIPIIANDFRTQDSQWLVKPPNIARLCPNCNHCKSASILNEISDSPEVFVVYIGDGHTDACPIQLADLVFAKGYLEAYCFEQNIPFVPFQNFKDIQEFLRNTIETSRDGSSFEIPPHGKMPKI